MAVVLIKESKGKVVKESSGSNYEVKQISIDIAVKPGTKIDFFQGHGNKEFFKALCKFLESQGMEMAGDVIESQDMTSIYKDNEYEFFNENLDELLDANVNLSLDGGENNDVDVL